MRQQLAHLQALNQADSLLTDDSLAQALALYFDDHGTPNEQMEAHYLLGRTYADRGEAPAAIAAYHDAIDRADTTAADCNYSQLWRVYSQIANVFYQQNLMDDFLYSLNKSIFFAKMCNDTLTVLGLQAHKMTAYERLNMPDSVLSIYKYVNKGLCDKGFSQYAAAYSVFAINSFLQKGQLEEARNCIRFYEEETGFFDETGNIEKGREVFFNYRGRYHLAKQQYDSAYHYFRKELEEGRDHNNQNAASKGLAQIFLQTGHPDSAAIYALYSYDMNDSIYAQMATQEVERTHKLYNYSRHQHIAQQEKIRANKERDKFMITLCIIIIMALVASVVIWHLITKRKADRERFLTIKARLLETEDEKRVLTAQRDNLVLLKRTLDKTAEYAEALKQHEDELVNLIATKDKIIVKLKSEMDLYTKWGSISKNKKRDVSSATHTTIQQLVNRRATLSDEEWILIETMLQEELPSLFHFLNTYKSSIGMKGYRICLLLRMSVRVKDIALMLNVQPSYISKVSTNILWILWKVTGSSKDLKKKLMNV